MAVRLSEIVSELLCHVKFRQSRCLCRHRRRKPLCWKTVGGRHRAPAVLLPGNDSLPVVKEAEWAPASV